MTQEVKKMIDQYRQKTARPIRSEMVVFRVTPEELDVLLENYGTMAGIRDFALASTDTSDDDLEMEYRLDADKADEDADKR
jgi:hypothetical protein